MLGSKFPEALDTYTAGDRPYVASAVFNQVAAIMENTQRSMGQDLGILNDLGNTTDNTYAKQFKKLCRVDFGVEIFTASSGTLITNSNQGTRKITVSFNTYGGSTVFDNANKIRVFVIEQGGNINSKTNPVWSGNRRDSGNVVDGTISTTAFVWRHDVTSYIGTVLWLAVQWDE